MILRGGRGQGNTTKGSVQLEGRQRPECKGQRGGSPVEGRWGGSTWHSRTQNPGEQADRETEAGRAGLLVAVSPPAPEASLLRLARSSCWAPPCLLQGGDSGAIRCA